MIRILAVVAGYLFWWSGIAHAIPFTGLTGLDRGDEVADEHGDRGRDTAELHHATHSARHHAAISVQNGSFAMHLVGLTSSTSPGTAMNSPTTVPGAGAQNGIFTTHATQVTDPTPSTIQGATFVSPTTGPGGDPVAAVPEPSSLLLLGSGLVGLRFLRPRKS